MNYQGHIEPEDLAMFALVLLSEEEAAAAKQHLAGCAQCSAELEQIRNDLAVFALAVEPLAPPEGVRGRFLAQLGQESRDVSSTTGRLSGTDASIRGTGPGFGIVHGDRGNPTTVLTQPGARPARRRVLPVFAWVGWAAAAAAVVVAVGLKQDRDALRSALSAQNQQTARLEADVHKARQILGTLSDPAAVRVNLTVPKAVPTPAARATYEQKSGTLLLLASNLAPLAPQKVYELWLIPADGSKPVPAGTFVPDVHGDGSLLVPALKGAVAAKAFGITVEQAGGSATPTLPILLAGAPG